MQRSFLVETRSRIEAASPGSIVHAPPLPLRVPPDPGRPEEVLAACRRARALGDPAKESHYLRQAFDHAETLAPQPDILPLLNYPDDPPRQWSADLVRASAVGGGSPP